MNSDTIDPNGHEDLALLEGLLERSSFGTDTSDLKARTSSEKAAYAVRLATYLREASTAPQEPERTAEPRTVRARKPGTGGSTAAAKPTRGHHLEQEGMPLHESDGAAPLRLLTLDPPGKHWRSVLAGRWASELRSTAYIPFSRDELRLRLLDLVDHIADALETPESVDEAARLVGNRLVEIHATGQDSLPCTLAILREHLAMTTASSKTRKSLLQTISASYFAAEITSAFEQKEALKQAIERAKLKADQALRSSEERFRKVFNTAPTGIAILDKSGQFIDTNPALQEILGIDTHNLSSMTIHELVHPDYIDFLAATLSNLTEAKSSYRSRTELPLMCAGDRTILASLAFSVLHDTNGDPYSFVANVEDITDLHMLQERFRYNAIHDSTSRLPNINFFRIRLQDELNRSHRGNLLSTYRIALNFDSPPSTRAIETIVQRLEELTESENSILACFGDTDFAIAIQHSHQTPDESQFAELATRKLSAPIDSDSHSPTATVNIGAVRNTDADATSAHIMWAADLALRKAISLGGGRWVVSTHIHA
ncbi:PAS domain S-box protein [Saccharopolyspora sp. WRP15-2]|uniref:PAS domain S-box protein n=1 Tax=Saccharopolyspora oryzae TaxID=2997343 RepID=A0ABT4UR03_9PSEU|nr:PAS domain S-box protein [Saccharopolyspora oryzae]MDA3624143.1 PAS domain S-box protein [Saccharopolyspora oryzae]